MKKILFSERYGLTQAVLEGRKTMTRRIISAKTIEHILEDFKQEYFEGTLDVLESDKEYIEQYFLIENRGKCFRRGDVIAVAQSYKDIGLLFIQPPDPQWGCTRLMSGYRNKRFVRADLMPHQICITNVRIERLQDISDEDCLREGIVASNNLVHFNGFAFDWCKDDEGHILATKWYQTPRAAFAALIDKVSGKGTFDSNPWVFVYEFELVK